MDENELSRIVVDCCFKIHTTLGPGLLESVYEQLLSYELIKNQLELKDNKALLLYMKM